VGVGPRCLAYLCAWLVVWPGRRWQLAGHKGRQGTQDRYSTYAYVVLVQCVVPSRVRVPCSIAATTQSPAPARPREVTRRAVRCTRRIYVYIDHVLHVSSTLFTSGTVDHTLLNQRTTYGTPPAARVVTRRACFWCTLVQSHSRGAPRRRPADGSSYIVVIHDFKTWELTSVHVNVLDTGRATGACQPPPSDVVGISIHMCWSELWCNLISSNSTSIHPNACGLIRIRLHSKKF